MSLSCARLEQPSDNRRQLPSQRTANASCAPRRVTTASKTPRTSVKPIGARWREATDGFRVSRKALALATAGAATLILAGYAVWAICIAPIAAAADLIGQTVELAAPQAQVRTEKSARFQFVAAQVRLQRDEKNMLGLGSRPRPISRGERDRLEADRRDVARKWTVLEAAQDAGHRPNRADGSVTTPR